MTTNALSRLQHSSLADAKTAPRACVNRVFERLSGQLGSKVADLYAGSNAEVVQDEWAAGLAGFHEVEIRRGVAACRERTFAPTLGEFLRLCRPALDPEWAFLEAGDCLRQRDAGEMGDWSHPAVWRAASILSQEVRAGNFKACRTRWEYLLRRELAAGWCEVPKPALRVEHSVTVRGPNAQERMALARLTDANVASRA